MKARLTTALILFLAFQAASAQEKPSISPVDRTRLAETFRLGERSSDAVWPGWSKAPFAVLLITPEYEFLIRHPAPSADFTRLGYDSLLKSDVFYRQRTQSIRLLATFPAIQGSMNLRSLSDRQRTLRQRRPRPGRLFCSTSIFISCRTLNPTPTRTFML